MVTQVVIQLSCFHSGSFKLMFAFPVQITETFEGFGCRKVEQKVKLISFS